MTCIFCQAQMKLVTFGRGFANYACPRGCGYYLSEEVKIDPERKEEAECVANA